jgi:hypothetical protein
MTSKEEATTNPAQDPKATKANVARRVAPAKAKSAKKATAAKRRAD